MAQIGTRRRFRNRPSWEGRWVLVMGLGLLVSLAYYAALIWAGVWVMHAVTTWIAGF